MTLPKEHNTPFSYRLGLQPAPKPISVRHGAPDDFRYAVVTLADKNGLSPYDMRDVACNVLLVRPDPGNWTAYPNVYDEVMQLVAHCEWYRVYDIAEAFYRILDGRGFLGGVGFEGDLNRRMLELGIGWQMDKGVFVARGSEGFVSTAITAEKELKSQGRVTAATEIHEALADISRRPEADRTGSIQHAMAALECLLKDLSGEPNRTLGDILKVHRDRLGIPTPLDQAIHKMWGYASQTGRHLEEGREPSFEEAELVVATAAALCSYLSKRGDLSPIADQ